MKALRLLPNALTLANLTCGAIASYHIAHSFDATSAVYLIFLAALFDLFDGAASRKLGVNGDMGRELDSLADVVSFGLAPSLIIFTMLEQSLDASLQPLKYIAFANVLAAAYRLARFNVSVCPHPPTVFSGLPCWRLSWKAITRQCYRPTNGCGPPISWLRSSLSPHF